MTDRELIKALRDCEKMQCADCPMILEPDSCHNTAVNRLEALLAENERLKAQMPKWRPASEPPKTSETVFARDMAGVVTTAYYNGRWHGMLNCDAVTHWMPLPSTEGVE